MRREETAPERELIEVDQQTTLQIYTEGDVNGLLEEVRKKILEATPENPDMSDKKTRDIFRSNAASIAKAKTRFDGAGKGLTDEWKAKSKKVDSVRKFFRDSMDYFKAEHREPLTLWEAEKAKREEEAAKLVEYLADWDQAIADNDFINREREVARKEAEFAKIEEDRKAAAEVERLEKERVERETRLQKEAADNAKREAETKANAEKEKLIKQKAKAQADKEEAKRKLKEAEQKRVDDAALAEVDKQSAIMFAKQEAADEAKRVERDRLENERIERVKAEKKAANVKHQKKINNEALACLVTIKGISADLGKDIIKAIASGKVDHISINY